MRSILETVKPHIDSGERTLTDPANAATLGSSMGGVVSQYIGYDWNANFKRVGCLGTAYWLIPNYTAYLKSQPARADLRMYMDVGNTGSTSGGNNNDGYWDSCGVRDNFVHGLAGTSKYQLEGQYKFLVGFGQNHNETSWAARLPGALAFLFPSQGEPNHVLERFLRRNEVGEVARSVTASCQGLASGRAKEWKNNARDQRIAGVGVIEMGEGIILRFRPCHRRPWACRPGRGWLA